MSVHLLLALAAFSFIASATPGPNNIMLLASGATFGFRRTIPHVLGIIAGLSAMIVLVGLGFDAVFRAVPVLYTVLQVAGGAYLLLLAWRIAGAGGIGGDATARAQPITSLGAAAFQWINPKAWVTVVALLSAYAPEDHYLRNVAVVIAVFVAVALPSVAIWAAFGTAIARRLDERPERVRAVNLGAAVLLVLSLAPLVLGLE